MLEPNRVEESERGVLTIDPLTPFLMLLATHLSRVFLLLAEVSILRARLFSSDVSTVQIETWADRRFFQKLKSKLLPVETIQSVPATIRPPGL